jgi:hypothetical protein
MYGWRLGSVVVGGASGQPGGGPPEPRRAVQSLWSGAAATVQRLACPRPVSGRGECHDRVAVVGVVVIQAVVIEMRRAPAGGQSERRAVRNVDRVLRDQCDGKRLRIRRIAVVQRSAPRTAGIRRRRWNAGRGAGVLAERRQGGARARLLGDTSQRKSDADRTQQTRLHTSRTGG